MTVLLGRTVPGDRPCILPLDIAMESIAILARKGMGKTHTARVLAEDFLAHRVPVVVIDPLDVWWGLRSNAAGTGPGEAVVIFGGSHSDLPLHETSGKAIADLVVDRGLSAVLVVDHLSQAGQRRFVGDFMDHLFDRKGEQANRTPTHIIIDEADAFAPQQPTPDGLRCLGAVDRAVRRGRTRGIGTTVITQRAASLSKNVLTQSELLIALQVNSPQDRAALKLWIEANAEASQARTFMDSLAGMQRGDAWAWSPSKLQIFQRIRVRATRTYDSSYTPKIGEKRPAAPVLQPVELEALRGQLAEVVAAAEANDPAKLKAEIARLRKEAAARPAAAPSLDPAPLIAAAIRVRDIEWQTALDRQRERIAAALPVPAPTTGQAQPATDYQPQTAARPAEKATTHVARRPEDRGDTTLPAAARALLVALVQRHPKPSSLAQLALLANYSPTSGGVFKALALLRAQGLMEGGGDANRATAAGIKAAGDVPAIPNGAARLDYWYGRLPKAAAVILRVIAASHPGSTTMETLCNEAGYSSTSGGVFKALAVLRRLELISRDELRVTDELMGGAG